ncbi:putative glycosyltransferase EpsF [Paenibacillus marchantiophytorum]|uniref:Glycosyltransferase EpsF n=1 Tax=Paenibacillus marchantiophytorum TaxID=1619310 RepID=A0ABQ1EPP9_9BACL|nr:glycosyltransferase [Paenibacillus marchantiophytorum]GFZ81624.1 putative glycosyltransferase EpsF [Paenibacillus marchantiophytorum]
MSHQPVRILHQINHMNQDTAQSFIMKVYRHIDRSKIQFDFIVHTHNPSDYDEEIRALGGRIFNLQKPYKTGWIGYIYDLKAIIQLHGPFHAIHTHAMDMSGFILFMARWLGIPIRIAHSHSLSEVAFSLSPGKMSRWLRRKLIRHNATNWLGSSSSANQASLGFQAGHDQRSKMLRNGIDLSQYAKSDAKSAAKHTALREQLLIETDEPIVGHIGRFSAVKNHRFLIEIFEELLYRMPNARLVLIGDGPLRPQIEEIIEQKGIKNRVHLLGRQEDIAAFFQELDVLVLPTFQDGLPMVLVEAQAAGVPCVVSDTLPGEANLKAGFFTYVSLEQEAAIWAQWLMKAIQSDPVPEETRIRAVQQAGYDIKETVLKLEDVYNAQIS